MRAPLLAGIGEPTGIAASWGRVGACGAAGRFDAEYLVRISERPVIDNARHGDRLVDKLEGHP